MSSSSAILNLRHDRRADFAPDYARLLLRSLGFDEPVHGDADHPALSWRRAGLMDLTGRPDGPAMMCPAPLAAAADGALLALRTLAGPAAVLPANGAVLLGERARLMGLTRGGQASPNGACRLLACRDGHVALNLARPDDWDLLAALFEREIAPDWGSVAKALVTCSVRPMVARAAAMGLAVSAVEAPGPARAWFAMQRETRLTRSRPALPRVVDFSALWAGPLAGALFAGLGAQVVKVESATRPDGARGGHGGFFSLLNGAKQALTLDFSDHAALRALVAGADIVIESSRPRALQQLGLDAKAFAEGGGIWISVTGHGRDGPAGERVGFGDDAAVAGGLAWAMAQCWGEPLFAGDAVADPLTGLHAALAGWALWRQGRGGLIALSLAETVRHVLTAPGGMVGPQTLAKWQTMAEADTAPLYPLRPW